MKHAWIFPNMADGPWNQCTCSFVANNESQMRAHNRANRNYRKRKKKRRKVHNRKQRC